MDMKNTDAGPLVADKGRRIVVFLFLLTAMFMATLDNQIVSTALPTIVAEFGEMERFGWIGSSYLLATSAVMPVYGKLGDLFGRKYVMIAAISIFVAGSLACGVASSMNLLIAARVLQGLGGGGIMVSIFSINADLFEPRERARYQSYSSLVIMASGAVGPILGGTISDLFGWRAIFLINLPIGIAVVTALMVLLPYRRPHRQPKIDYAGAALLAAFVSSIVLWTDSISIFGSLAAPPALAIVAAGFICLALWVRVERRAQEPVMPIYLFRDPAFPLLLAVSTLSGALGIGLVNYFALFLQTTTGLAPVEAGAFFIPLTVGIVFGALLAGRLISRTGRYRIFAIIGLGIGICVFLAFAFVTPQTPLALIAVLFALHGIGVGLGQQVPITGVQNAVPKRDIGTATGAVTLTRMSGAAIGISIYGAIVSYGIAHHPPKIDGVADPAALSPSEIAALPDAAREAVAAAYSAAFMPLFLTCMATAALGLLAALLLKPVALPVASRVQTEKQA
ncbi:MFS transporter [Rhizobiaceae bacterium BDR2-2]|uniref:MFS transporter n=1 Tax=Ectorhizobium quercum TaxID=2965071 RepID=A0AAE3N2L4_9HYPH|nr:MDR family MFS transporter [Ectorhizobium quercum]MCX8998534.1 MFS transporter [Ectorhizobium quercum]